MNMKNQIKVVNFTQKEIDLFLRECNFSPQERELFLLRSNDKTLEESAEIMNVSSKTAYRINRKLKQKIVKVCSDFCGN